MQDDVVVIEGQIQQGNVISESDMLSYINAKSIEQRKERARIPQDQHPFTVIWYNHSKSVSEMFHTYAKSSVEAIIDNQERYPKLANVSAYPLHLPRNLKFAPDDVWETA